MILTGDFVGLLNPVAALGAGVVTSLHCVGMCGPLSCALVSGGKSGGLGLGHGLYHLGRLVSYSLMGGLAGVVGGNALGWMGQAPAQVAPWALVFFFVIMAFGLDRYLTRWQANLGVGRGVARSAYRVSGHARGLALGLATPLIPCGPLYLMLWVATMSGSLQNGIAMMAAFALGTMPALLLAQAGWSWLARNRRPETLLWLRRGLSTLAIAAICLRVFLDTSPEALVNGEGICR